MTRVDGKTLKTQGLEPKSKANELGAATVDMYLTGLPALPARLVKSLKGPSFSVDSKELLCQEGNFRFLGVTYRQRRQRRQQQVISKYLRTAHYLSCESWMTQSIQHSIELT